MMAVEARWRRDFENTAAVIPAEWIWTDPADGWQGILPEYTEHPLVVTYARLCQAGYANGWL